MAGSGSGGVAPPGNALKPFAIIATSYLLFTITDGAVRMVVLLHANGLGFSALEVAAMFSLYELAGVVTNLVAGMAGDRYGLRSTLVTGLVLQLCGLGMLLGWDQDFSRWTAIVYVTLAQMLCGIAKDLTKLGGKTVTKLVTPDEKQTALFKLVALLTGFKNSLKGVGYFLGAAILSTSDEHGYDYTIYAMMALVLLALPWPVFSLSHTLGRGDGSRKAASLRDALSTKNANLNRLSLARTFLFASRDFWFEVPLPFFLRAPSCTGLGTQACSAAAECVSGAVCAANGVCANPSVGGGCGGLGADRVVVGTFLALYIIVYGQVQSWTPQLVSAPLRQSPPNALVGALWGAVNVVPTAVLAGLFWSAKYITDYGGAAAALAVAASSAAGHVDGYGSYGNSSSSSSSSAAAAAAAVTAAAAAESGNPAVLTTLVVCIAGFAVVFGVNSSVHSYLVVRYAKSDKVPRLNQSVLQPSKNASLSSPRPPRPSPPRPSPPSLPSSLPLPCSYLFPSSLSPSPLFPSPLAPSRRPLRPPPCAVICAPTSQTPRRSTSRRLPRAPASALLSPSRLLSFYYYPA
jgi:MFS family permease